MGRQAAGTASRPSLGIAAQATSDPGWRRQEQGRGKGCAAMRGREGGQRSMRAGQRARCGVLGSRQGEQGNKGILLNK